MYKKKKRSWVKHLDFIILDLLAAELALYLGVMIKFNGSIIFLDKFEWFNLYQNLVKILPFIDLAGVFFTETYKGILRRTKYEELISTIWHSAVNFLGVLFAVGYVDHFPLRSLRHGSPLPFSILFSVFPDRVGPGSRIRRPFPRLPPHPSGLRWFLR